MAKDADFRTSADRNRYKGSATLTLDNLADYLQSECDAVTRDMEKILKESADELKEKIISDSPVDEGEYKEGWIVSKRQKPGKVEYVVRNKTKYQLTHLLEHGHDLLDESGTKYGEVPPYPHINDNADKAIRKCGDKIDNELKKG